MYISNIINEQNQIQTYISFSFVKSKRLLTSIFEQSQSNLICTDIEDIRAFYNEYLSFCSENKNQYKKKTSRHGVLYKVLIPYSLQPFFYPGDTKKRINKERLVNFIKSFTKSIRQEERHLLKYVAYYKLTSKGYYAYIYICDRFYISDAIDKTYNKTMYIDPNTKKFCSESPNAIIAFEKGKKVVDKNGNTIKLKGFITKTRRFSFKPIRNEDGKDIALNRYHEELTGIIQHLFRKNVSTVKGTFFKRKKSNYKMNRYQKRIIVANNQTMDFIERNITDLINKYSTYKSFLDKESLSIDYEYESDNKNTRRLKGIFKKYQARFNKGSFTNEKQTYSISNTRCDIAEENLQMLRNVFINEISEYLTNDELIEIKKKNKTKEYIKLDVELNELIEYTEKSYKYKNIILPKKLLEIVDGVINIEKWFYLKKWKY